MGGASFARTYMTSQKWPRLAAYMHSGCRLLHYSLTQGDGRYPGARSQGENSRRTWLDRAHIFQDDIRGFLHVSQDTRRGALLSQIVIYLGAFRLPTRAYSLSVRLGDDDLSTSFASSLQSRRPS
jgi:hypothetical protein